MNVGIGTVAAQCLFWEYFFKFSVFFLCSVRLRDCGDFWECRFFAVAVFIARIWWHSLGRRRRRQRSFFMGGIRLRDCGDFWESRYFAVAVFIYCSKSSLSVCLICEISQVSIAIPFVLWNLLWTSIMHGKLYTNGAEKNHKSNSYISHAQTLNSQAISFYRRE